MEARNVPLNCSICETPTTIAIGWTIHLLLNASWQFPIWCNFSTGVQNQAIAIICDGCGKKMMESETEMKHIKFAVEIANGTVKYHKIAWTLNSEGNPAANWIIEVTAKKNPDDQTTTGK